ncbi:MAG TPA: TonB family protein [Pseudomonadales bacterium]|nr:TonB family protein [Pseudomonadales bacterium]
MQQKSDKCRGATGSHYLLAAMIFSVLLHAGAVVWWFNRPAQPFQVPGVQAVTVDLIALAPPVPQSVPQQVQPPSPPPEPEPLRDDEMAEKHTVIKKKPPEKKPRPVPPRPVQEQPVTSALPAESRPAPVDTVQESVSVTPVFRSEPIYPNLSRQLGEEGKVLVRVQVSADGSVLAVKLEESSGFKRLDAAALDAVAKYRFTAIGRTSNNTLVPINFKFEK